MSEATIAASALAVGYPDRDVLRDVSFECRPGTVTALMGPNGSGKSTLLKAICGSLDVLSGSLEVAGEAIGAYSPSRLARTVAFVPQQEEPKFGFSVRQIVLMGRIAHGAALIDSAEDHAAAEQAMETADCRDLADRAAMELSGGERQRVLLARALAQEAPVLLLDEPTAHLDIGHQLHLRDLLRRLAAEGRTIVLALHDFNQALAVADRMLVLHGGRLLLDGDPEQIAGDPALERVYGVAFRRFQGPSGAWLLEASQRG